MTSTDDDLVLPPAGWTPTDADLALLNDEPEVSMDADLGGQAEELKGQEWMNLQRKQAALEEVRQGIDRALRTQEELRNSLQELVERCVGLEESTETLQESADTLHKRLDRVEASVRPFRGFAGVQLHTFGKTTFQTAVRITTESAFPSVFNAE